MLPLEYIQANILKPHGRDRAWFLFLKLSDSEGFARRWAGDFAYHVNTSQTQADETKKYKEELQKGRNYPGNMTICFFLTPSGFGKLHLEQTMPKDEAFLQGMQERKYLNDPPVGDWERNYRKHAGSVDAMIMLAHNSNTTLRAEKNAIEKSLDDYQAGEILFVEKGKALRHGAVHVEHFGYMDGIGESGLYDKNEVVNEEKAGNVLFNDSYGSFLVFRKLEQNVEAFNRNVRDLATKLAISEDLAGAQIIGRFKNGMPLSLSQEETLNPAGLYKSFKLKSDILGDRCPLHAHVRKANPRTGTQVAIVRRGMPYGKRLPDLSDEPESGVGLLFMCYQKDIAKQFELIQSTWCNEENYPQQGIGIDPIAGQADSTAPLKDQQWNKNWDDPNGQERHLFDPRQVVKMQGGFYFYAPPKSLLLSLKYGYSDSGSFNTVRGFYTSG